MRSLLPPLLLLAACGTQEGSEKGLDDTGIDPCSYGGEVELAPDEASPLGFSGQDILDWLGAGAAARLSWSDDSTSTIRFTFAPGTRGVRYEEIQENPKGGDDCTTASRLWVGVAYTITTDDGRLDESGDFVVVSETAADARLSVPTSGTGGPLDGCVNGEGGEQELEAPFSPTATTGRLDCEGSRTEEMASW